MRYNTTLKLAYDWYTTHKQDFYNQFTDTEWAFAKLWADLAYQYQSISKGYSEALKLEKSKIFDIHNNNENLTYYKEKKTKDGWMYWICEKLSNETKAQMLKKYNNIEVYESHPEYCPKLISNVILIKWRAK